MKKPASSFEEHFRAAGERELLLREVDQLIRKAAPNLEPVLFQFMGGGVGFGYGMMPYKTKSMKEASEWPLIGLVNQKNYVSVYLCAITDGGEYIAEKNKDRLGKVSVGKSCIRFKKRENINLPVLSELIENIAKRVAAGEKLFGV